MTCERLCIKKSIVSMAFDYLLNKPSSVIRAGQYTNPELFV